MNDSAIESHSRPPSRLKAWAGQTLRRFKSFAIILSLCLLACQNPDTINVRSVKPSSQVDTINKQTELSNGHTKIVNFPCKTLLHISADSTLSLFLVENSDRLFAYEDRTTLPKAYDIVPLPCKNNAVQSCNTCLVFSNGTTVPVMDSPEAETYCAQMQVGGGLHIILDSLDVIRSIFGLH